MGNRLINVVVVGLLLIGFGVIGPVYQANAAPNMVCAVTSDKDVDAAKLGIYPGTLRSMLLKMMQGLCFDNKIIIQVPKITLNAPLGIATFAKLKGLVIEPGPGITQAEIVAKYDQENVVASCTAVSPFDSCLVYLPANSVTIRGIKLSVDPGSKQPPTHGICIDKDEENQKDPSTNNKITIEDSFFDGFIAGGVVVSPSAFGVQISRTGFTNSSDGIVIQTNPKITLESPLPPVMGGGSGAIFALLDNEGKVKEYHLRGLSTLNSQIKTVELFERTGKAGSKFVQACATSVANPIDGQWNIDCVLPKSIKLPYDYAVTVTSINNGTSMFATGTIPVDVAKLQTVVPTPPQAQITPPAPVISTTNSPVYQNPKKPLGDANTNDLAPLTLKASPTSGGCSLIR